MFSPVVVESTTAKEHRVVRKNRDPGGNIFTKDVA